MFSFKDEEPVIPTIMVLDDFDADTETDSDSNNEVQVLAVIPGPLMTLKHSVPSGDIVPVPMTVSVMIRKLSVPSGDVVPVPVTVSVTTPKHSVP